MVFHLNRLVPCGLVFATPGMPCRVCEVTECGANLRTPYGLQVKGDLAKLQLTSPVCTKEGEKVALSRRVEKHWRLIGWGKIQAGTKLAL